MNALSTALQCILSVLCLMCVCVCVLHMCVMHVVCHVAAGALGDYFEAMSLCPRRQSQVQ